MGQVVDILTFNIYGEVKVAIYISLNILNSVIWFLFLGGLIRVKEFSGKGG